MVVDRTVATAFRVGSWGALLALVNRASPIESIAQVNDLPEFSCSSFLPDLNHGDLVRRFGVENVASDSIWGLDNGPALGTIVFAESDEARLEVMWWDPDVRLRPWSVRAVGVGWRTPHGIYLGMDLLTVERLNGMPFRLGGLDWEPLGVVRSWGSGRLEEEDIPGCRMAIHFQTARDGTEDPQLLRQIRRGREFSSGHPAFQALNPVVAILRLYYPPVRNGESRSQGRSAL
jgi:hypothetical protein